MSHLTRTPLAARLRGLLLALALLLAPLGLSAAPALAAPSCVTSGTTVTCTFSYTGAPEAWVVPAGVTSATFDLYGARGSGTAGYGGRVTATLAVTPGDTYQIRVGGSGGFLPGSATSYNGGGRVGSGLTTSGGSGGGASDVRSGAFALADRLLVAGGGGGGRAGGPDDTALGGAGGYPSGGAGSDSGGGGGTQTAGGAGGYAGGAGSLGQGGAGQSGAPGAREEGGGSGGGGGYYGGGGTAIGSFGAVSGGGGGGSSYATPAATSVSFETGVRLGDGLVIVSYTRPDSSAPTASPSQAPAANADGWNNTDVTVSWNWADAAGGSGIDSANCTTSSVSSGEGAQTLSATCQDLAGNQGSASHAVKVDKTAPTVSAAASSGPNANGWYNGDVTVAFSCADALAGVASCPASQTLAGEGTGISSAAATATDRAGNTSALSNIVTVQIDRTAPTVSAAASSGPNSNGWYNGDVTVAFSCADDLAGVGSCPASQTLAGEGASLSSAAATATDRAGNTSAPSNIVTVQIDRTAPVVLVTGVANGATYTLGSVPAAACSTSDALSGVATAATLSLSGSGAGSYTATCAGARDNAGNSGSASVSYTVAYAWAGFFQPVDNLPTVNTAKAGSAIPIKFSLGGNFGLSIIAAGYPKVQKVNCSTGGSADEIEQTVTAGASSLSYDAATGQYSYTWKTEKSWAGSCRLFTLRLSDGSDHSALFQFR
ncbi:MAG: PxKF domain-containing protein [Kouleothrix sp.]|jgi:hypothetical protein|nr:PxKF domain-containing protein [Kouleothrix sp.]